MYVLLDSASNNRPQRRTALVAAELQRYNIDTAALSETRLSDEGSLTEVVGGYTFFWKGNPTGSARIHGVGFAVRSSLLPSLTESPVGISERLMSMRNPLTRGRFATLLSAYAPTLDSSDEEKNTFYAVLHSILQHVPRTDKLFLLGDFNARVGSNYQVWQNCRRATRCR